MTWDQIATLQRLCPVSWPLSGLADGSRTAFPDGLFLSPGGILRLPQSAFWPYWDGSPWMIKIAEKEIRIQSSSNRLAFTRIVLPPLARRLATRETPFLHRATCLIAMKFAQWHEWLSSPPTTAVLANENFGPSTPFGIWGIQSRGPDLPLEDPGWRSWTWLVVMSWQLNPVRLVASFRIEASQRAGHLEMVLKFPVLV